jgi:hypothetical protein
LLTKLENLESDKHSSLLQKSVNYGRKSFIPLYHTPVVANIRLECECLALSDTLDTNVTAKKFYSNGPNIINNVRFLLVKRTSFLNKIKLGGN